MLAALSPLEAAVLDTVDAAEATELLRALIRARSDYPPGDTRQVIDVVADKLASAGIAARRVAQRAEQVSLIAEVGADPRVRPPARADTQVGPYLLLHAHADTVGAGDPAAWTRDPFGGEVVDGRLYGRGAGDDKGSLAAQVMALVCLARTGVELRGRLQLAAVADEESGGLAGTKWLRDSGHLRPDALVVGEQTNNRIAIAERVACGIDLTVYGVSAHGATPWEGENAILNAAQALSWLQARLLPRLGARKHPFLPPPTLNVGRIAGGTQWNIVPDRCTVAMDRRLLPGESRESAMAEIRAALDEYSAQVAPLRYDLTSEGEVAANINTSPAHPFARAAAAALQAVVRLPLPVGGVRGGRSIPLPLEGAQNGDESPDYERRDLTGYVQTSDGRWFAGGALPIIIFGPGDPALAHAADEHIAIDQLIEAIRFLTLFSWRWLSKEN